MNKEKRIKIIKIIISVVIVGLFVWFLIAYPLIEFKNKENSLTDAGKRYFEINSNMLPTGNRVKTVTIKQLYDKNFLDTLTNVYSKDLCSLEDSFVKVKRVDGNYKYYTYLKCGIMSSLTDHKGPEIKLNGKEDMTIEKGSEFKDPGVKSIIDDSDGKMDTSKVSVKGKVDTTKVGTYKISYIMYDSLANKGEVVRTVKVIETLSSTVKRESSESGYYKGTAANNYIELSNMLFRIIDVDSDGNVRIAAAEDIASIDYDGMDDWLNNYYYDRLNKESKRLLTNTKYCIDKVDNDSTASKTKCNKYVSDKKVGTISVEDVNNTTDNGASFLRTNIMAWLSNKESNNKAWTTRNFYIGLENTVYMSFDSKESMIVKPVLTIKKGTKVIGGDGSLDDPYKVEKLKTGKAGDKLNARSTGEYIKSGSMLYRIIETTDKGTVKVISDDVVRNDALGVEISYSTDKNVLTYNPNKKGNIGYDIQNNISKYLVSKHFVNTEIEVPIYKDRARYKKETSTKKYKVLFSAPSTFDLFSGQTFTTGNESYWYKDSSQTEFRMYYMNPLGNVSNDKDVTTMTAGVRVVGYINKDCTIVRGTGTLDNPYTITK